MTTKHTKEGRGVIVHAKCAQSRFAHDTWGKHIFAWHNQGYSYVVDCSYVRMYWTELSEQKIYETPQFRM